MVDDVLTLAGCFLAAGKQVLECKLGTIPSTPVSHGLADFGPVFFSISDNWLRISFPLTNSDLSEDKVKGYVENLVNLAFDNHDLWDPKVLAGAGFPNPGLMHTRR